MADKEVITLPDKERLQLTIDAFGYKSAKSMLFQPQLLTQLLNIIQIFPSSGWLKGKEKC